MKPADLDAWRAAMGFTRQQACDATGVPRRTWYKYERGQTAIPLTVQLACAAVRHGIMPSDALRARLPPPGRRDVAAALDARLKDHERNAR